MANDISLTGRQAALMRSSTLPAVASPARAASIVAKPTYAEVARPICPPAQSLLVRAAGSAIQQGASALVPSGLTRGPAITTDCKDVFGPVKKETKGNGGKEKSAKEKESKKEKETKKETNGKNTKASGAAKKNKTETSPNENKTTKEPVKKKNVSELALLFEKQNKPIILSGGKNPQKKTDWFSDIKIVNGPELTKKAKEPKPEQTAKPQNIDTPPEQPVVTYQVVNVSPDHPPVTYQVIEVAPKMPKDDKTPVSEEKKTKPTSLEWATKKPLKKWEGDTPFKHPDVYLKKKPVGLVNPYKVLSGHGGWNQNVGYAKVPKGTSVTVFAKHGASISDRLGNSIEHGDFETLRKVFNKTYTQGERIPNYILSKPVGLNIEGQPTLTRHDILLSDLLEKNMGHVLWAACCAANGQKYSDYSFDVDGMHKG
jgi:hypothetical protein